LLAEVRLPDRIQRRVAAIVEEQVLVAAFAVQGELVVGRTVRADEFTVRVSGHAAAPPPAAAAAVPVPTLRSAAAAPEADPGRAVTVPMPTPRSAGADTGRAPGRVG
jgi:hypothetical protein